MTQHLYSRLGDTREHATSCALCQRSTWNICGLCDNHCAHVVSSQPWRQAGCSCIIDAAGTRHEMRVVAVGCGVHGEGSR
jgi:hypothetical protein